MDPLTLAVVATLGLILCSSLVAWLCWPPVDDVKTHPEILDEMSTEWRTAQQRHRSQELHGLVKLSDRRDVR